MRLFSVKPLSDSTTTKWRFLRCIYYHSLARPGLSDTRAEDSGMTATQSQPHLWISHGLTPGWAYTPVHMRVRTHTHTHTHTHICMRIPVDTASLQTSDKATPSLRQKIIRPLIACSHQLPGWLPSLTSWGWNNSEFRADSAANIIVGARIQMPSS